LGVSRSSGHEGHHSGALRALVSEARPLMRAVVEPLPARLRIEEGLAERPAVLEAVHFPETEEDEQEAARGSRSRSCSCSSSRWPAGGAAPARGPEGAARSLRAAWWWTGGGGRCRSS
jgi:hypothetical protein